MCRFSLIYYQSTTPKYSRKCSNVIPAVLPSKVSLQNEKRERKKKISLLPQKFVGCYKRITMLHTSCAKKSHNKSAFLPLFGNRTKKPCISIRNIKLEFSQMKSFFLEFYLIYLSFFFLSEIWQQLVFIVTNGRAISSIRGLKGNWSTVVRKISGCAQLRRSAAFQRAVKEFDTPWMHVRAAIVSKLYFHPDPTRMCHTHTQIHGVAV